MRAERRGWGGVGIAREVARGCGDAARLAARFVTRGCTEGRRRSKNGWTLELY